mgnify:CR=1 FL=1
MNPAHLSIETVDHQPPGGQHVGAQIRTIKVSHLPTGLSATCGCERSQLRNRDIARAMIEAGLAQLGWPNDSAEGLSTPPITLESAIELAAATLPTGYLLRVVVERGAGWLELTTPAGEELEVPGEPCDPLAELVAGAVLLAQQHAASQRPAAPVPGACPKCGARLFDPFKGTTQIHWPEKCGGLTYCLQE